MRRGRITVWVAIAAVILSAASSWADEISVADLGINITTNDGLANSIYDGGSPALGIGGEDNETERVGYLNTLTYQSWDLEAIFWNSSTEKLTIVGGFDYLNGNSGEAAGDLFIGDNTGYNTVLDLSRSGENLVEDGTFKIWQGDLSVEVPSDIPASTPYKYLSGGTEIDGGDYSVFEIGNDIGLEGWKCDDTHYALVIETGGTTAASLINAGNDLHFTLECGNDLITGKAQAVPEPGIVSLLLLGVAFLGFNWKRKS